MSCPFSGRPDAIWPMEYYKEVYKNIIKNKDYYIFVTGSESESLIAKKTFEDLGPNLINVCGKLNIIELSLLFQKSKVYFGNDTGPMHLAALVKIPCVAIFSSTNNPGKFYPQNQNNTIFQSIENMKEIEISEVTNSLIKVLKNTD